MEPGNTIARIVAGVSGLGLVATLPTFALIARLQLSKVMTIAAYLSSAAIALCCGLILFAMLWGIHTDWTDPAKTGMLLGLLAAVPAAIGSFLLIYSGISGEAGRSVNSYFLAVGILGFLLFALPALAFVVMAGPGRP